MQSRRKTQDVISHLFGVKINEKEARNGLLKTLMLIDNLMSNGEGNIANIFSWPSKRASFLSNYISTVLSEQISVCHIVM